MKVTCTFALFGTHETLDVQSVEEQDVKVGQVFKYPLLCKGALVQVEIRKLTKYEYPHLPPLGYVYYAEVEIV